MNAKQDYVRTIEEQIDSIPMSQYDRDAAYRCLRIGAMFTGAVTWFLKPVGRNDTLQGIGTPSGFRASEIEGNAIC